MAIRRISATTLVEWATSVLRACKVDDDGALATAAVLVDANLTGVDTHGVSRLRSYVSLLLGGHLNGRPDFKHEERAGSFMLDADHALGQVGGLEAVRIALEASRSRAIVGMTITNIGHLGALGHFVDRLADQGRIALLMQNSSPSMSLAGSRSRSIGNSPLAFAAPVAGAPPLVFDIATSEAAFGKIIDAAREGRAIPLGWAQDQEGAPTRDAKAALQGALLPAAGHKGIGLAMMIEVLAGSLTGVIPRLAIPEGLAMPARFGAFLLVVNPDLLLGRAVYDSHMADWINYYKAANPHGRYPGERLAQLRLERRRQGVPLSDELMKELAILGEKLSAPFPQVDPEAS